MMDFPAKHVRLLEAVSSLIFMSSKFYHVECNATQTKHVTVLLKSKRASFDKELSLRRIKNPNDLIQTPSK